MDIQEKRATGVHTEPPGPSVRLPVQIRSHPLDSQRHSNDPPLRGSLLRVLTTLSSAIDKASRQGTAHTRIGMGQPRKQRKFCGPVHGRRRSFLRRVLYVRHWAIFFLHSLEDYVITEVSEMRGIEGKWFA